MVIVDETDQARFAKDGYLVLSGLLDPERDLSPLQAEYESLLDVVAARLQTDGVVSSTHAGLPFGPRFCALVREMGGTLRLVGDRRVALEMNPGDVLFLTKLTMHASLPNLSQDIRWSVDLRYQPIGEPTGRPWFPGFVARSRAAPERVLSDAGAWAALWHRARERLAADPLPSFQRWPEENPDCA